MKLKLLLLLFLYFLLFIIIFYFLLLIVKENMNENENESFGFIVLRHVNKKEVNLIWNHNIKLLRKHYPNTKILIIDDNSNQEYIEILYPDIMHNIEIVNSEYHKRGEFLPYYYYYKLKPFDRMIFLHDTSFIDKKINYNNNVPIQFLCSFDSNLSDNSEREIELLNTLNNSKSLIHTYNNKNLWKGCWCSTTNITWNYLNHIVNKYNIMELLNHIQSRLDRMCLERVIGVIIYNDDSNFTNTSNIYNNHYSSYYVDNFDDVLNNKNFEYMKLTLKR